MDWYPLWNSLRIAVLSIIVVFFLGILLAYYVAKLPRIVKGLLDVVFTLPLVLPPTVCGWLLLLVFGLKHPVGIFLQSLGVQFVMTWYGGVLAASVVAFPLMYRTADVYKRQPRRSFEPRRCCTTFAGRADADTKRRRQRYSGKEDISGRRVW